MKKSRILEEGSKKKGVIKKERPGQSRDKFYPAKKMKEEILKRERELQALKTLLDQKEIEIKQLKDEVHYKNQQLASKDIEMETYKNATEEKIFILEAKIKELEARGD